MIDLEHVKQGLELPDFNAKIAHLRMSPVPRGKTQSGEPRKAGVLVLLYPHPEGKWHVLLTRRTETLSGHSGQISFPGGKHDPSDFDFTQTALRETCEELGICHGITILGGLTPVYIPPSHYDVFPSVAYLEKPPTLSPNQAEVAEVLSLSLEALLDDATKGTEFRQIQTYTVRVPYYAIDHHKVWGATAIMLSELEQRLRAVLS